MSTPFAKTAASASSRPARINLHVAGKLIAADLPVHEAKSGLQVVADYRIRAAVTWRF